MIIQFLVDCIVWLLASFMYVCFAYPAEVMIGGVLVCIICLKMFNSLIAQSVEHSTVNRRVVGSSPTQGATKKKKPAKKTPQKAAKPVVEDFSDEYKLPQNPFA